MKAILQVVSVGGLAMLAGCYSMDVATSTAPSDSALAPGESHPTEHVVVSNYGWFLFNIFPIVCGNAAPGASFPWKFFTNQVSPSLLHDRLTAHAAARGADVTNLTFFRDEQVFFDLPGSDIPLPIPYLVCFREIQFSGILTPRRDGASAKDESSTKRHKAVDEMRTLLDQLNPEADR